LGSKVPVGLEEKQDLREDQDPLGSQEHQVLKAKQGLEVKLDLQDH
jgi:hypothetical protein